MPPNGPHDMPPMGPPNMNQGPQGAMQNFGSGEGPPNPAMMPPGGGSARSFYDNFYQQQQSIGNEGGDGEGELFCSDGNQKNMRKRPKITKLLILEKNIVVVGFCHFGFSLYKGYFLSPDIGDDYMGGSGGNFSEQSSGNLSSGNMEGQSNGGSINQSGITVPDFLPPAQRVLFMRIQQKQQEEEERARRLAEGGPERDNEGIISHPFATICAYLCTKL